MSDLAHGSEILVRSPGGEWNAPTTSAFESEKELQKLILSQPTLVPGVSPLPVAVDEFNSGVGPADVCIVGSDGEITIVECKLAANAEVRRKVVGQVLDYASQIWRMTFHDFDARWRQRSKGVGIVEALGADNPDLPARISRNLSDGRFDLVLAVDRINPDLRRIVAYLNHITGPQTTITALELRYASYNGVEILVPSVYGAELAAAKAVTVAPTNRWTLDDVLDWMEQNEPANKAFVADLFETCKAKDWRVDGTFAQTPSALIGIDSAGGDLWPFTIYTNPAGTTISINFQWIHRAVHSTQLEFLDSLADKYPAIDAGSIKAADLRKRPSFAIADIAKHLTVADLVRAADHLS